MATLHELSTVYSVADVYLLLEILMIDLHNGRLAREEAQRDANYH